MVKMKMPKMPGKDTKPHIRMRKMKPVASSAFPPVPMAFPPQGDPAMSAAPDPSQGMATPATAAPPGAGDMGS